MTLVTAMSGFVHVCEKQREGGHDTAALCLFAKERRRGGAPSSDEDMCCLSYFTPAACEHWHPRLDELFLLITRREGVKYVVVVVPGDDRGEQEGEGEEEGGGRGRYQKPVLN